MKLKQNVRRYDLGEIRSATRTPQGFLMCPGFATRTGVFPYTGAQGTTRLELRHPDDVCDPVSLATLKFAPITIEHPPDMITPDNVAQYGKGHSTERVEVNRDLIDVDLIVENRDAIDAVEKHGIRELSSGYTCDVVEEEGVFMGCPYTHRQKNIKYNHIALVKRGRAGPEVRLRLDSADAVQMPKASEFSQESSVNDSGETKKVIILGREVDLPSDLADCVQDLLDRSDEVRAKQLLSEEQMAKKDTDKKDVDINQKGVSPQVKVEQQTPDGRAAGGKTGAKPGSMTGGGTQKVDKDEEEKDDEDMEDSDDDQESKKDKDEDEKDDADEEEKPAKKDKKDYDSMKKDMDEKEAKHDAEMAEMKKKLDAFANKTMNEGEKKEDSADTKAIIRARVKLERHAEKLVPSSVSKKFDSMTDKEIYTAVIKSRSPKADLEGKSKVYLQSRFDSIVESSQEDGSKMRENAGKAMLGIGGSRMDSDERTDADPEQARKNMIAAGREAYKLPLSKSKKQ